jgi:hypothetical protein
MHFQKIRALIISVDFVHGSAADRMFCTDQKLTEACNVDIEKTCDSVRRGVLCYGYVGWSQVSQYEIQLRALVSTVKPGLATISFSRWILQ